jgi:sortase (surface protein transpeptidase)
MLWIGIAVAGAVTGLAFQLLLGGSSGGSSASAIATGSASVVIAAGAAADSPTSTVLPAAVATAAGPEDDAAGSGDGSAQAPSEGAGTEGYTPPAVRSTGLRLRVPALGIDAQVIALGFDGDGQLAVPADGSSVGWYEISPRPGEQGNALLGAHFDWNGALAVFYGLDTLSPGDRVYLDGAPDGELVYEVSGVSSVDWDSSVVDVLATDVDGSSLTLFTCGGDFDSERHGYDQRLIVRAVQVETSTPLTARR